jgi:hypothetical protein
MLATVHVLHPQPTVIGGYLRVGHTGHRLEALHAAGTLKFNRLVFDAAHIDEQIVLLRALKASGYEVILDPNFAKMVAVGQFRRLRGARSCCVRGRNRHQPRRLSEGKLRR